MNALSPLQSVADQVAPEQLLNGKDECFRAIFENAPFGVCVTGLNMNIVQANSALSTMLGYSTEELLQSSWASLTHPDDIGPSQQIMEMLIHHPIGHHEAEKSFIHRSGAEIWTHIRVSLIRDSTGAAEYFVVYIEDITGRNRTNDELRETATRFRAIADSCPSMMWATDPEGSFQFSNRAFQGYCGIAQETILGSDWKRLIHPDDAPKYTAALESATRESTPFNTEVRVKRADLQWRLLGLHAEPRLSSRGEYLGHIGLCVDITDRIQSEQTRQFELSLIRSIHDETLEGILVVDESGVVVSRNRRFLEIWELSNPKMRNGLGNESAELDDQSFLSAIIDKVEAPEAFLNRVRELYDHPDEEDDCEVKLNDSRTLERHSKGLRNQDGKYLGRVWFFRDITAFRQAEVNLQLAKESADEATRRLQADQSIIENERQMLHGLIDNIPEFMYVKDLECRFVVANPHLAQVIGVETPDQLHGKTDFDFYPRELAGAFYDDDQYVITSGQPLYNREEKGLDRAGNEVDILTTKVPIRDSNGLVIGIAGVGRDVSTSKKAEDALREAERKYRGIFDNAINGIFQSTPDGRFLSVNPALATMFGYASPEEMMAGITDISQQCYADPKRRNDFITAMRTLGSVVNFEGEAFCKDGTKIWVSMSVRGIHQSGVLVRFEGMCEDITERNQLRQQLLAAQKLESVGQLAAGIAHEINTPTQYIGDNVRFLKEAFSDLRSILSNYERLLLAAQDGNLSSETIQEVAHAVERSDVSYLLEEIPKAIEQTLEGVTRVSTLVSAMKEFSHPGTKEKVLLDLNHAIDCTITVARNEWKYVADMETDFDSSLPLIPCLPGEFNQVVLNLIVNAAHAISDAIEEAGTGKGKITLKTLNCQRWAEIRVTDTGTGIPAKVRDRIFDPFFTTKEIGKGTGQGLAIARSVVVDKHGGTIHFETGEGKGTTFIIRLPFGIETPAQRGAAA